MNGKRIPAHEMTVGQLLAQVGRMSGLRIRRHMEKIGLHRGQGFALVHLWHNDGMTQRDLSRTMHISPASVTNMLQRMERDEWIERRRDKADQRVVRVFAAKKAMKLRAETERVFREMEEELNLVYTQQEQDDLRRLLIKLHEYYAPDNAHPNMHGFLHRGHPSVATEDQGGERT